MDKRLLRSLSFLICSYTLSIVLLLLHPTSASTQVGHSISTTPLILIQVAPMTLSDQIFRRWTHSREEDQGDILVYRPNDYPFPPARGREGLEFRENGEFIRYQIGPTDSSLAVPGQWIVKDTNIVEVQFPNQSALSYTLTILECNEQILKVRQTAGVTS